MKVFRMIWAIDGYVTYCIIFRIYFNYEIMIWDLEFSYGPERDLTLLDDFREGSFHEACDLYIFSFVLLGIQIALV
jgi:hypothetical protein